MAAVDRDSLSSLSPGSKRDRARESQQAKGPLQQLVAIRKDEWPLALLMFGYFFAVVTTFWILKPLKKGLFISFFKASGVNLGFWHGTAAQGELIA